MFDAYLRKIDACLNACLPDTIEALSKAKEMIAYSLDGGGKRVRPLLCLLFCEAAGGDAEKALYFAAAIEYIHTYSLIHDDMPCMDNDDFRRGKPTVHKRFGEENALLTGDVMLTEAFAIACKAFDAGLLPAQTCLKAIKELADRAGVSGMAGGQILDVEAEGKAISGDALLTQDALKTGALIECACVLGLIAAGADETQITAARNYAKNLGLAFQITDDLLEYENAEENSDERNQKATYISVFGYEKAKAFAERYTFDAIASLRVFENNAAKIIDLSNSLLHRRK